MRKKAMFDFPRICKAIGLTLMVCITMEGIAASQEAFIVTPSVSPPEGGNISPPEAVFVSRGGSVEFTATANRGIVWTNS